MNENLKKEFEFFKDHQDELVAKYRGKFLVIKGEGEVVDAYDTQLEAYHNAKEKYELGTFLIQECLPGKEVYTQTFHSRVTF
jgi:hypothetical protein